MNEKSAENVHGSIKKFTRIMVFIALGFVGLYIFIFMQLKQTESQLTSYGNISDSAIGNFLEKLPESNSIKIERTVDGITFVVKGGEGSSLNADMLDSKDSGYFLNLSNMVSGTLSNDYYDAWGNLESKGYIENGKIKPAYLPLVNSSGEITSISWNDITNKPTIPTPISESQVRDFVSQSAINLSSGSTVNSQTIASQSWVSSQGYLSSIDFSQLTNGVGIYLDYRPNNTACSHDQVLKYDAGLNRWICANDAGAGAVSWGAIGGTLADQTDLQNALNSKLNANTTFGGDVTGTYDNIAVSNDSHSHTGATISGLAPSNFSSPNISQWANDAGYLTSVTKSSITNSGTLGFTWNATELSSSVMVEGENISLLTNDSGYLTSVTKSTISNSGTLGFTWGTAELASTVMVEGENISLLNNDAGFLTGVTFATVTNAVGVYLDYRPNNSACAQDQVLKYDAGLNRWICGTDIGIGSVTWGAIGGTLADQNDLQNALNSKLNANATFGGDVTGTYDSIAVSNDSHSHTGATISGLAPSNFSSPNISQWTNDAGYISGVNFSQIANGSGVYLDYRPNNTACDHNQVLKYDAALTRWICSNDQGAGTISWGDITGDLSDQSDITTALSSKLNTTADFAGDISGTYDNITVSNDSHSHTGATISGLTTSNFTSQDISQWTNNAGYISGVNFSQITNGSGVYLDYRPNNTACLDGQILIYSSANNRWLCGENAGGGGGGGEVTIGSMTGTSLFTDSSADDDWLGLGASAGRIQFDDQATDSILLLDANVGIGTTTPTHTLTIAGNLGIEENGYLNFGDTNGSGGYGLRDASGVIELKNLTGSWDPIITEAPADGKYYARKDEAWVEIPVADNTWSTSNIEWFVGGTKVTLSSNSTQRYKVNNGVVTIVGNLIAQTGVNLTGVFELRNFPVPFVNEVDLQITGHGEWTNQGTNFVTTRLYVSDTTNDYMRMSIFNTFTNLSDTVNGTQNDGIQFILTYETTAGNPGFAAYTPPSIMLQQQLANGTDGGAAVANTWSTLAINTEVYDSHNKATLSSNQFTLQAGTYDIDAESTFYNTRATALRLRNISDSTTTLISTMSYLSTNGGGIVRLTGRFTIESAKTFELQYIAEQAQTTYGLGTAMGTRASNYTGVEIFRTIRLIKIQ
ncbi:MAG: hypothetical protein QY312_00810 [Candidatus Dojkabacteria bacterium]|nr:MAG: hypothetical protein QY312_00810 [Candidatus Dojkabacteria bacterium]